MKVSKIEKESFSVSNWSGGTTTQLFISPEHAELGKRNFDIRISSANFTTTNSKFSDFSGYTRFILPLKGTLCVRHPNRETITLSPYQVYRFDGGEETDSENSIDCIDFNLIVKHEIDADLEIWNNHSCEHPMKKGYTYFFYSTEEFRIHVSPAALTSHNEGSPSHKGNPSLHQSDASSTDTDILATEIDTVTITAGADALNADVLTTEHGMLAFEGRALHILSPDRNILAKTVKTDVPVVVCKVLSV